MKQRLHEMQFQKVKVISLQQTEFLNQDDLVDGVGYLLLEMKILLYPWGSLDQVVYRYTYL